MRLDELSSPDDTDDSAGNSSSSSTEREFRVPYMAIWYEDGEYHSAHRPQDEELHVKYTRPDSESDWSKQSVPSVFERYWMNRDSFEHAAHVVEEVAGENLRSIIQEQPKKSLDIITKCQKMYGSSKSYSMTEKCPVCREEVHVIYDDYETLNSRRLCPDHTVSELIEAGVTDRAGSVSNRIWE